MKQNTKMSMPIMAILCLYCVCTCNAYNYAHCIRDQKMSQTCAGTDIFGCQCIFEQTACYDSTGCNNMLTDNKVCIAVLGIDDTDWTGNCGRLYEHMASRIMTGWASIFSITILVCGYLIYKATSNRSSHFESYEVLFLSFFLMMTLFLGWFFIDLFISINATLLLFLFMGLFFTFFQEHMPVETNAGKKISNELAERDQLLAADFEI